MSPCPCNGFLLTRCHQQYQASQIKQFVHQFKLAPSKILKCLLIVKNTEELCRLDPPIFLTVQWGIWNPWNVSPCCKLQVVVPPQSFWTIMKGRQRYNSSLAVTHNARSSCTFLSGMWRKIPAKAWDCDWTSSDEVVISEGVTKAISGVFVVSGLAECVII